jgi:hypothetical protein
MPHAPSVAAGRRTYDMRHHHISMADSPHAPAAESTRANAPLTGARPCTCHALQVMPIP